MTASLRPFFASLVVPALLTLGLAILVPGAAAAGPAAQFGVPVVTAAPPLDPAAPIAGWPAGSDVSLTWDVVASRTVNETTVVHAVADAKFLYVRFDATQREPIFATQRSNDTITGGSQGNNGGLSWSADDAVWVDLWPTGSGGFRYQFEANPNGAHNEASTENAAFAPQWETHGAAHDGGYTVTMAIPLGVVHGAHTGTWRAQFVRYIRATGAEVVWSYDIAQSNADDVSRAGPLGVTMEKAKLPSPRLAAYGLGSVASAAAAGSTSRVGADISVPITQTAAVFAAFHPDYSNVESDQQSIAPTVYQRQYSEVRPFFTQAASYYNNFNCDVCSGYRTILYTPAIPTFSQGYAFEGKNGNFGLASFDAIGVGRNDSATALDYTSPDAHFNGALQHVTANIPGITDSASEIGLNWSDKRYVSGYFNVSNETGTLVTDPGQAYAFDGGGGYSSPHFALFGSMRAVGSQFNPVDGYSFHSGIGGYALYSARIWTFSSNSPILSMGVSAFYDHYQGPIYGQAQSDQQVLFDVLTKSAWDLQLYTGSDYFRVGPSLIPVSQNGGFQLTYHSGLQTNNSGNFPAHGSSDTPTVINYSTGAYGAGHLDTWFRTSTIRAGVKGTVTLTLDNTSQWITNGPSNVQWFDGLAYSYQVNRESSFAIGLRRVIGDPPQPNGGGNCMGTCSNVSVAYHLRLPHEEIYLAYGNPNTLTTVPQALLKVIFYVGGQKGT